MLAIIIALALGALIGATIATGRRAHTDFDDWRERMRAAAMSGAFE